MTGVDPGRWVLLPAACVLWSALCGGAEETAAKPLVLFVGDSITASRPTGNPDYKVPAGAPSARMADGNFGYFEALYEATAAKNVPYRFDKLGNGGQPLDGWIGRTCRKVLERRSKEVGERPAVLVVQDYDVAANPEEAGKRSDEMRAIVAAAAGDPKVTVVFSTVVIEPGGTMSSRNKPEDVEATNRAMLKTCEELKVPIVRLDLAWARYMEAFKDRKPAMEWKLTGRPGGRYFDGVHPGKTGAFFQALVFARELGIPADRIDENAAAIGLPAEQASEIKKFVYGWKEPTALPPPSAPSP